MTNKHLAAVACAALAVGATLLVVAVIFTDRAGDALGAAAIAAAAGACVGRK